MGSGSFFQDYTVDPGFPDGEYWRCIIGHLLAGQSVEVIDDGDQSIILRLWYGVRKNDSNEFELDPDGAPF